MANLSAISFHARKGFVAAGVSAKLSHVQELVAAALGHNTLASYQTASEDTALAGAAHVVLDTGLLEERASKLGLSVTPPQLLDVVSAAAKIACPAVQIHASVEDFGDVLQAELESEVESDDRVASEMASCNHDGVRDVSMPVDPTVFTDLVHVGRGHGLFGGRFALLESGHAAHLVNRDLVGQAFQFGEHEFADFFLVSRRAGGLANAGKQLDIYGHDGPTIGIGRPLTSRKYGRGHL